MLQEVFRVPYFGWPIYGYGLMLVIGFLVGSWLASFLARRSGLDPEVFINATLLALVSGIIGARLSHIIENIGTYTDGHRTAWENLRDAMNIRSGGLTYYGGFLLAFPTLVAYAMWKKVPVRRGMDIVAPVLMVGLGFGRIGCFLNGCCYGAECDLPWAVSFPYESNAYVDQVERGELHPPAELLVTANDGRERLMTKQEIKFGVLKPTQQHPIVTVDPRAAELARAERSRPVHPAQLYSAFTAFLLIGVTYAYYTMPHAPGQVLALMMALEGIARFVLELLRVEPTVVGKFSLSMVLGLVMAGVGAVMWFAFREPPDEDGLPMARDGRAFVATQ